jgi:hypothetical protein
MRLKFAHEWMLFAGRCSSHAWALSTERQVLDDEEIVVHPACSTGEAKVFQPHGGVGVTPQPGPRQDSRRTVIKNLFITLQGV